MFTVAYRTRIRDELIEKAREDPRIDSAAAVGGSAQGEDDRWSDLDLTFGVRGEARDEVLADWTRDLRSAFDAVTLFDVSFLSSIYRVFLMPGSLQVDLSFTPASDFGPLGTRFALLFGSAVERKLPSPASPRQEFGLAAHHAVRARYCIARGRLWQAEYWISQMRDHTMLLACRRLGLPTENGRGFDTLPDQFRTKAEQALVHAVDAEDLMRALRSASKLLFTESSVHEDGGKIEGLLREILD